MTGIFLVKLKAREHSRELFFMGFVAGDRDEKLAVRHVVVGHLQRLIALGIGINDLLRAVFSAAEHGIILRDE